MAHEWHAGVLTQSSWHGLETIGSMPDAQAMIAHGERSGAWPVDLEARGLRTDDGLVAPGQAIVGRYLDGSRAALGVVSDRYTHLAAEQWRDLVRAAIKAGARPTGAFALRHGSRVLATFEVGAANGIRTQLCLVDSFDRSTPVLAGTSSVRVVCANTLSAAMSEDGAGFGRVAHRSSLGEKVVALGEAIERVVTEGGHVRDLYDAAAEKRLSKGAAEEVLAKLFPVPEEEGATRTKALKRREDAILAANRAENNAGPTLATIWNAATWLVDREVDGTAKTSDGTKVPRIEKMLFGARGRRVEEIKSVIEVVMADGSIEKMDGAAAHAHGIDYAQIGRAVLDDLLDG